MTASHINKLSKTDLARDSSSAVRKAFHSMIKAFDNWSKEKKLSKHDLAKLLGIDKALVSRRLNGTSNLTLKSLSAMASAMECYLVVSFMPYTSRMAHNRQWHDDFQSQKTETSSKLEMQFKPQAA